MAHTLDEALVDHLRSDPLSPPDQWPAPLQEAPELEWIRKAVALARSDGPSPKAAVAEFDAALEQALERPREVLELAEAMARADLRELTPLRVVLSLLLSRGQGATDEAFEALESASIILAKSALETAPPGRGAAIAVKLARLYQACGREEEAEDAWKEAIERQPMIAWAVEPEERALLMDEDPEQQVLEASEGQERALRQAIIDLRSPATRAAAVEALSPLVESGPWRGPAALLLAIEELRAAARLDPSSEARRAELLRQARQRAGLLQGWGPLPALLETIALILEHDEAAAAERLSTLVEAGSESHGEVMRSIVAALASQVRRPPHAIDEVVRVAFFEAMVDPTTALEEPRSAYAKLRVFFVGLALATAVSASLPAVAMADGPADIDAPRAELVDQGEDGELPSSADESDDDQDDLKGPINWF